MISPVYAFLLDTVLCISLIFLAFMTALDQGYKKKLNRAFILFTIFIIIWVVTNHLSNDLAVSNLTAHLAAQLVFVASLGAAKVLSTIISIISKNQKAINFNRKINLIVWPIVALAPLVVAGTESQEYTRGVLFTPFVVVWVIGVIMALAPMYYAQHRTRKTLNKSSITRRRVRAIVFAASMALPLTVALTFILPVVTGLFWMTSFGLIPLIFFAAALYWSVIKHGLFDIRSTVVRTVAYILAIVVLSIIYFSLAYLISLLFFNNNASSQFSLNPLNIALAIILALLFQPIKNFFDRITNFIFFRNRYSRDQFYGALSEILVDTTRLSSLLKRSAHLIARTLSAEQVFFAILTDKSCINNGTINHARMHRSDILALAEFAAQKNQANVLIKSRLDEDEQTPQRIMRSYKTEVVVILKQKNKLIGLLALGPRLSSVFTARDISVLQAIADELTIGIQNALSMREVQLLNETLQQRVDEATRELRVSNDQLLKLDQAKDEFISMASHQLRTPLTSIKGYIDMILQGDAGKITATQRRYLNEAFVSSERMVHLINDFLSLSRLQTGKFLIEKQALDLAKIIHQEIDSLSTNAKSRQLTFDLKLDQSLPRLKFDESKIRQVIMNFADNAIYYSKPNSTIEIVLKKVNQNLVFTVKDSGIGVPQAEQKKLFGKFYRAQNARKQRPDGTGVGLFLAKKVITSHGGKIIFESQENKGSTFGFSLPLDSAT